MSYFLADDSHFSSGYISFHYSTQQASATAGTQQLSLYLNASLGAISWAWESWKNDAPTVRNTSMNSSLSRCSF